jgi:hypothetical protein
VALRRAARVLSEQHKFWALSRYENCMEAHRDIHDRLRKLVNRAFTPRRIADWEPVVAKSITTWGPPPGPWPLLPL